MDDDLDITARIRLPVDRVQIRTSRSSGPGGQHANMTASRVEASIDVAALAELDEAQRTRLAARFGRQVTAIAQDTRSQTRNRELALQRLAQKLRAALVVQAPRRASRPTRGSVERRLQSKRRQSTRKQERRSPPDA